MQLCTAWLLFALTVIARPARLLAKDPDAPVVAKGDLMLFQTRSISGKVRPAEDEAAQAIFTGDTVLLRTRDGRRIHSDGAGVWVASEGRSEDHEIVIEKSSNASGALHSGDVVFLRTHAGRHLGLLEGGAVSVGWDRDAHRDWEKAQQFVIERQDGNGALQHGDAVYIVAHTGLTLVVEGKQVRARWPGAETPQALLVEKVVSGRRLQQLPSWVVHPLEGAFCDPSLECHRRLDVSCRRADGTEVPLADCNHERRPWSYEPCFKSPQGACIDIASSDCMDVTGNWWNDEDKTCAEFKAEGNCSSSELVQSACRASCSDCEPAVSTTPAPAGCHDDSYYRSTFNWNCQWFQNRNCSEYVFHKELKKACPRSCRLC